MPEMILVIASELFQNFYPSVTPLSYHYAMVVSAFRTINSRQTHYRKRDIRFASGNQIRIGEKSPVRIFNFFFEDTAVKSSSYIVCCLLTAACIGILLCTTFADAATLADVPETIVRKLDVGIPQDIIVLYDDQDVEAESLVMRHNKAVVHDDDTILSYKAGRFKTLKERAEAGLTAAETETVSDYSHLPMRLQRFKSRAALEKFLLQPEVKAVYEDKPVYPHLASSLPFIGQPSAAAAGFNGSGQTVLVIDTGINYKLPDFGSCSANRQGVLPGCRVVAAVDVNGAPNLVTTTGNHGTNVAGIVAGVAPGSKIASFNALPGGSGTDSTVIAGINWGIAKKITYGITTINMSLGDSVNYTTPCSSSLTNPYVSPIANARSVGILAVASSGNNAYIDGISSPACTPGVVSVGAVYDSAIGGWNYGTPCTDSASAADNIVCFSNSAAYLTILAPGAQVTAAGITMFGTSQASPHAAGAIAVMRAAYPADSLDQLIARLTTSGVSVTDSRNGFTLPRLNLQAAVSPPANDLFTDRAIINGEIGVVTAHNFNATVETGEPNHAEVSGGRSVWWSWTAPSSGVVTIDTHGSAFDTLLAVYTGSTLSSLVSIAANDNNGMTVNTSSVSFAAQAGTTYQIAVDGVNSASGILLLSWNLLQQADLALGMTGPVTPIATGETASYNLVVTNNGPSSAAGVTITDAVPAGSVIDTIPPGCTEAAGTISCSMGTLAVGGSATANITLHFAAPGDFLNSAQVSATTSDPLLSNNSASISLTNTAAAEPVPGMPLPLVAVAALALTLLTAYGASGKK